MFKWLDLSDLGCDLKASQSSEDGRHEFVVVGHPTKAYLRRALSVLGFVERETGLYYGEMSYLVASRLSVLAGVKPVDIRTIPIHGENELELNESSDLDPHSDKIDPNELKNIGGLPDIKNTSVSDGPSGTHSSKEDSAAPISVSFPPLPEWVQNVEGELLHSATKQILATGINPIESFWHDYQVVVHAIMFW